MRFDVKVDSTSLDPQEEALVEAITMANHFDDRIAFSFHVTREEAFQLSVALDEYFAHRRTADQLRAPAGLGPGQTQRADQAVKDVLNVDHVSARNSVLAQRAAEAANRANEEYDYRKFVLKLGSKMREPVDLKSPPTTPGQTAEFCQCDKPEPALIDLASVCEACGKLID